MLSGTYPGVYLFEAPSGVRTIVGAPTAVAAFVGPTRLGADRRATRVASFGDFERAFGGLSAGSYLSYGVMHFFQNGGGEAVVVRVPNEGAATAQTALNNATPAAALTVTALGSGEAANNLFLEIEALPAEKTFSLSVTDAATGARELWSGLSTDTAAMRYAKTIVNDADLGSRLVSVDVLANAPVVPVPTGTTFTATPVNNVYGTQLPNNIAYSIKASVKHIAGGAAVEHLAETEIPLFAAAARLPASASGLAQAIEDAINAKLAGVAAPKPKIRIEATVLDYRNAQNATTTQLRFRVKAADLKDAPLPDAVIEIKNGDQPSQQGQNPPPPFLAFFGLTAGQVNASRIRLGADYQADNRVKVASRRAGSDGNVGIPTAADMTGALSALDKATFNLLCMPDAVRPQTSDPNAPYYSNYLDIYEAAKNVCESRKAFLLLDPPPNVTDVQRAEGWKKNELTVRTSHGATYFPRVKMTDPLSAGLVRPFPPSGLIAGLMARTDANRGVWKSPAGIDATVNGVYAPQVVLSDSEHGILNPMGVNCLRKFPIYGTVSFGARTLVGSDAEASEWKYVAVRRTASYILLSLQRGLQWVTFEPNDEPLWGQIRMNVTAFMQGLFRQGAFQGRTPREAYLVKCDAEITTQADINQGIVNVVVGFAPLKPAEFVFVTLRQLAGQTT